MDPIDTNLSEPIEQVFGEGLPAPAATVPPENTPPAPEAAWWEGADFKDKTLGYKAAGKDVNEDIPTVLKRASMGYHYAQNMTTLNNEREAFKSEQQRVSDMESKWKNYDDYARQNPEWANHVNQSWESRGQQQTQQPVQQGTQPLQQGSNIPPEYAQKIESMDNFMQNYQKTQDDKVLSDEVNSVRGQYKDIDFDHTDPGTGLSLENQVLEHANNTGINNFRAAFRDYYHDNLVRMSAEQAKKDLGTQIQSQNRQGILSQSDTPHGSTGAAPQIANMDDAFKAAANELGITNF